MVTQEISKPTKPFVTFKELPLVGVLPEFGKDRLGLLLRMARMGEAVRFHFGPFAALQFNTAELAHSVLVEHAYDFDKGPVMHNAFEPLIGKGLFISEGDFHRKQRKLMAPSFQPRQIISYADSMVRYGEQIQNTWRDGDEVDISHEMTNVTMSIIGKVLFDADVFTETDELGAAMTTILSQANYTLSHLFPIPLNWPTPDNRRTRQALATLNSWIYKLVDERKADTEERDDFLSILLRAQEEDGAHMSDSQVRDEALTLFGAGHETTATALTWAWYLLTQNPGIYQQMQQEIDGVLQGRAPTYADLARLPYTLQVFKETMRLYPPAYVVSRAALHDVEVEGYLVSKGQTALLVPYAMHRKPEFFPDPEKFDPERFTPENEKQLPRYAYLPFGAGPRVCIGNHFAMMEGHLLLATLAQRVTFELVAGQHIEPDPNKTITIRPKYGMKMIVRKRDVQTSTRL